MNETPSADALEFVELLAKMPEAKRIALNLVVMLTLEKPENTLSASCGELLGAVLEPDTRAALEDMFVSFRTAELNQAAQQ